MTARRDKGLGWPRVAALLVVLLLAGCGPQMVDADVTRFTTLVPPASGLSFSILPDQGQRGSLEFESYAQIVSRQLEGMGWRPIPATPTSEPGAVVFVHWGVGPAQTETWATPYGGWGWPAGAGGPGYAPFSYWDVHSVTVFPKWLAVDILDGPAWRASRTIKLFEGRAATFGTAFTVTPVVPYLAKALFTGFPGASGQTVRISVPMAQ